MKEKKFFIKSALIAAVIVILFTLTVFASDGFNEFIEYWKKTSLEKAESIEQLIEKGYGDHICISDYNSFQKEEIKIFLQKEIYMNIKTKKKFKITAIVVCIFITLWAIMLSTDYWQTTHNFEKPIFARCSIGFDDGGSGTYRGIGYSIEVKGNFMPEDELPGVTYAKFMILGKQIKAVIRD